MSGTVMQVNQGYFVSTIATPYELQLPETSVIGDVIRVSALSGLFQITQPNAGSIIYFGDDNTTLGAGGSITSQQNGDTVELVCYNANAGWQVLSSMGNFTIV